MSEKRRLLEAIYADWDRGDYTRTDWFHPDFELVFAPGFLDEGVFQGLEEAGRGWRGWLGQWALWRTTATRYIELDEHRFAVVCHIEGTSKTTGVELAQEGGNIWEFEGGLPRRLVIYAHERDLLRDLGTDAP